MAGRTTDRKKTKEPKSGASELSDTLAAFTLPDSLPCSEVEFPIVVRKKRTASWKEILEESDREMMEIEEFNESKREPIPKSPFQKTECDYIKNEVFVYLIPALEEALNKAKIWEALKIQKCFFNGIDHIVQVLWNNNPRYPERQDKNLHLFNMPWVRNYLKENASLLALFFYVPLVSAPMEMQANMMNEYNPRLSTFDPRPYYPKSWLWPEEYAATLIQKTVRQYFVQREEEVQEMRDFWKKLKMERNLPDMETNPFLARKFASLQNFRK